MGGVREQLETLVDVAGIEPATPCFAMNFKNAMWLFFLAYLYAVVRGFGGVWHHFVPDLFLIFFAIGQTAGRR